MTKKIKLFKDFTYYSLIKEAIYSSSNRMITANDIFNYFVLRYPDLFRQSNSMTWKGNIRQVLSKNPEFIKINKKDYNRLHYWTHKPEENRLNKCLLNKQETSRITTNLDRPYDYYSTIVDGRKYQSKVNKDTVFIKKNSIIMNKENINDSLEISTGKNVDAELKNILDLSDDHEEYRIERNFKKSEDNIFENVNYHKEISKFYLKKDVPSELEYKIIKGNDLEEYNGQNTNYSYEMQDYRNMNNKEETLYDNQKDASKIGLRKHEDDKNNNLRSIENEEDELQDDWHILNTKNLEFKRQQVYEEPIFKLPNTDDKELIDLAGEQQSHRHIGSNCIVVKAKRRNKVETETQSENITNKKNEKSEYFYDFNDEKVFLKKYPKK